ncbi:arginine-tRNA-protein transferase [Arsenicibacter rosenii]|uniref:Arginine-tRNA-protein transferase n=1 Tax=Arsenicibacter rosenii TaxID=1750698 RepID=A0A1S2VK02_9BACT|nr:arginine-tRNA-protein transferase [Arsenicibacter rosenii]OIN59092.1 arginine-tRNA-protein transferase [Arsenicibacter rosenii]
MIGNELDFFLSIGYFRMHQDIFTCQYILADDKICPVYWLRMRLEDVQFGTKQARILRQNSHFSTIVRPLTISDEHEALYAIYRNAINFDAAASVESCLLNGVEASVFDTYIVEIRDRGQLIAGGIFDNGNDSIAGIMNFYHPDYRKYSLGKYLMMQKILYAQQQKKVFYYPGYIATNYTKFDYKLFPCEAATEVFDDNRDRWLPFSWEAVNRIQAER